MSIFEKKREILDYIEKHRSNLNYNENIFEILEGKLIDHVQASLKAQLSPNSYKTAMERVSPINIFRKAIMKRSTLYTDEVLRETELEQDEELISYYEQEHAIDSYFEDANKNANSYKYTAIEFYMDKGEIKTRALPSHHFLPYSDDEINPMNMTAMIKFMGNMQKEHRMGQYKTVEKYWVYTDTEFMAVDSEGDLVNADMAENEGVNEFGVIPFVYINKSRSMLVPYPDQDDYAISVLVPCLLTDLNFAAKFLAHSVFFGIDIDIDEMQLSPDAVWLFKSDERDGKKPEIGTIKPEVSIEDILLLIREQLSEWLDTKNIKSKGMGQADVNNTSGIAKLIDEADVTLDRKQQVRIFRNAEKEYWRTLATIHNVAAKAKAINNTALFSDPENLIVKVEYSEQKIMESRDSIVDRLIKEVNNRFIPRRKAIEALNPKLSPEEIDNIILEIDNEFVVEVPEDASNEQED